MLVKIHHVAIRGIAIISGQLEHAQACCGQERCSIFDPNKDLIVCYYWNADSMPTAHDPFGSVTIAAGNFLTDFSGCWPLLMRWNVSIGCHINHVQIYIYI